MENLQGKAIKFKLVKGIVLMDGKIDHISGYFALDTGATQTVLNKAYCRISDRGVKEESTAITFDNGTQNSRIVSKENALLTIADKEIEVADPLFMDMAYVEVPLRTEDSKLVFLGSVGADMIGKERLIVDYIHKQVIFNAENVLKNAKVVQLSVEKLPIIELEIQEKSYRFVLDTGASNFVIDQSVAPMEVIGNSSDAEAPYYIKALRFAGKTYSNLTGIVTDLSAVRKALSVDGIIGYQLLKDYICCFDYKAGLLYLSQE